MEIPKVNNYNGHSLIEVLKDIEYYWGHNSIAYLGYYKTKLYWLVNNEGAGHLKNKSSTPYTGQDE